jgi:hypothetical protein
VQTGGAQHSINVMPTVAILPLLLNGVVTSVVMLGLLISCYAESLYADVKSPEC